MATTIGKLNVMLGLQSQQFTKGIKDSQKRVGTFSTSLNKLAVGLGAAFSARSLINGMKQSLDLYAKQESAVNKLAASLKLAGDTGLSSLKDFEKFASGIQSVTTFGDETVLELSALGASLGKLTGQQLKDATTAAIGLSKVAGIDATSAMKLLSRAAQGGQVDFGRYGIIVDKSKSIQEQFNQVLDVGTQGFTLATAELDTYAGKMQSLSNTVGDVQENIGQLLAGPVSKLAENLNNQLGGVNDIKGMGGWATALKMYAGEFGNLAPDAWLNPGEVNPFQRSVLDDFDKQQNTPDKIAAGIKEQADRIKEVAKLETDRLFTLNQQNKIFSGQAAMLKSLGFDTTGLRQENGSMKGQLDKYQIGGPLIGAIQSLERDWSRPISNLTQRLFSNFRMPATPDAPTFGPVSVGALERGSTAEYSARLALMGGKGSDTDKKVEKNTDDTAKHTKTLVDLIRQGGLSQDQIIAVSF